jgi:hypothetical protein
MPAVPPVFDPFDSILYEKALIPSLEKERNHQNPKKKLRVKGHNRRRRVREQNSRRMLNTASSSGEESLRKESPWRPNLCGCESSQVGSWDGRF